MPEGWEGRRETEKGKEQVKGGSKGIGQGGRGGEGKG